MTHQRGCASRFLMVTHTSRFLTFGLHRAFLVSAAWVCLNAGWLAAQGGTRGDGWVVYRSPDSSWVISHPKELQMSSQAESLPSASHLLVQGHVGSTSVFVDVQKSQEFAGEDPLTTVRRYCAECYGRLDFDSTWQSGPNAVERAVVTRSAILDPRRRVVSLTRVIATNGVLYVVTARSNQGQELAPGANLFVESFTACNRSAPCQPRFPESATDLSNECCSAARIAAARARGPATPARDCVATLIYTECQVEKPVMSVPYSPQPRYPDELKGRGINGEVVVSFTVDTTGHVELPSVLIVRSTDFGFTNAVREALPRMVFVPAEAGGCRVRQRAQQPFVFTVRK